MDINKSEIAEFLNQVKSKSSSYSKQDMKEILTKLVYLIKDVDDVSTLQSARYESRSISSEQLRLICEMLQARGSNSLNLKTEQQMLISILEISIGNLMELTNKKLESLIDIFIKFYYKGAMGKRETGILDCDFVLGKLTECYSLATIRRSV